MPTSPLLHCLDVGAGALKHAVFHVDQEGDLWLDGYDIHPWTHEKPEDPGADALVLGGMTEWLTQRRLGRIHASLSIPGHQVMAKFLTVPKVDPARRSQILRYEAQQHFPLPPEEMVWDYQALETSGPQGESVLLAGARADTIERLVRTAEGLGPQVDLVEAAPVALANAFRYNYAQIPGCSMVLDLGARSATVLFCNGNRVFFRTLNLGGNLITQELAAEARLNLVDAEQTKCAQGSVAGSGVCDDLEPERSALAAKIARQFMTRLHAQVAQTIQIFRSQQGGAAPDRLFLAGGTSRLPGTAEFFAEKLSLPVEFFNPFRAVRVGSAIPLEELAPWAPSLGPIVGLALRSAVHCPLELNLLPGRILRGRERRRKAFGLGLAAMCLVAAVVGAGWCLDRMAREKQTAIAVRQPLVDRLTRRAESLKVAIARRDASLRMANQLANWMNGRFAWADLLMDLRRVLEATEASTTRPEMRTGVWIERMTPELPEEPAVEEPTPRPFLDPRLWAAYLKRVAGTTGSVSPALLRPELFATLEASSPTKPDVSATNKISTILLTCRAVSWRRWSPTRDTEVALAFLKHLERSPYVATGTAGTCLSGTLDQDEATGTFTFEARLVLKEPINL